LHNIRTRYSQHSIYTYSGIVLIALNPFDRLVLYSHDVVQAYSGKRRGDLEPHLFAIAEDAYRRMAREGRNQTIVVSGESGAGKTVSAKYVMRYFATAADEDEGGADYLLDGAGGASLCPASPFSPASLSSPGKRRRPRRPKKTVAKNSRNLNLPETEAINQQLQATAAARGGAGADDENGISETEAQILATNPIMEAFGNAKTTRNDNSSRFGKHIEFEFDEGQTIVGARIRTYLLERSRLVFQPETERNYHIFYQLVAGAPPSEKKELGLGGGAFEDFHYLSQGNQCYISGVDDAAEFEVTQRALSTIGIAVQLQWQVFRLLAALLHIGNIRIAGGGGAGDASIPESDKAFADAARLLGVDAAEFRKWLVKKQIATRSEKIVSNLKPPAATAVRDAVAKYIYANIFDWLVRIVNSSLSLIGGQEKASTFIGVLDIYGFEHFEKNSFE
ncbi:MAG: P-loop containing nucleoside triphosphate hydrolase protein, partial [Olpidium bornovanus]